MTREELLNCLTDRPCSGCKFKKENGCSKWSCVFEGEIEDDATEAYKKGFIDSRVKSIKSLNDYANDNYPKDEKDDYHALVFSVIQDCIEIVEKEV